MRLRTFAIWKQPGRYWRTSSIGIIRNCTSSSTMRRGRACWRLRINHIFLFDALRFEDRSQIAEADGVVREIKRAVFAHFFRRANRGAVGGAGKRAADADSFCTERGEIGEA